MAKHYKAPKQFYSVSTRFYGDGANNQTNVRYFEKKKKAIDNIQGLFDKCYPSGTQAFIADNGEHLQSPSYDDHDCHLVSFYTTGCFCYELSTLTFEDI